MIKWNERSPFYFTGSVFLLISIVLSLVMTFQHNKNYADFFPCDGTYNNSFVSDKNPINKIIWYFSQITHQTQILLFIYFLLSFLNKKEDSYFKFIAPLCLTVSALYFYLLFPKQNQKIYQLSFCNFFSHFMVIFLIFGELYYVKNYNLNETTYCLIFLLTSIITTYINYYFRKVWPYDLIKLDTLSGWLLVSKTLLVIYFFSFLLYFIKPGPLQIGYKKKLRFFSCLSNLILVIYLIHSDLKIISV